MNKMNALKYITRTLPVLVILFLSSCTGNREVTTKELQNEIKYLSSDSLKGRLTGSPGDSLAAEFIRNKLTSYGLNPLSGDGFQRFRVTKRVVPGKANSLSINGINYSLDKDFMPLAFSSNSGLESEVIFAGYGFNINGDSVKWNDYTGLDVKGKWVMVLRADPESENTKSPYIPFSGDRDKALLAKDMGAAGVLLISGPAFDPQDTFESLNSNDFSVDIPVLRIKKEVADIILSKSKTTIAVLEKKLNGTRKPAGFSTKVTINGHAEIVRETTNTRNVVMLLPGEDNQLKNEYIIIGAHFDHLGMGGPGSPSRSPDTIGIHHGADDNASGVAMMLELAEKFAMTKGSHKRSIICIAFTGEEEGLFGSKHFTDDPGIDLSKVNVMINLDMVGRLNDTSKLQISGVGTATGLKDLIYSKSDTSVIKLTLSDEGYGPSDHSSFYGRNIPVLFYFTGAHLDYHTPSDTYDKINYTGMVKISDLIFGVAEELASSTSRLQFKESGPKAETVRYRRGKGVTLGIMPDFAGVVKNGLRADFVTPGKPAALGGMQKGDIIKFINGKPVNNIQDYMFRMGQLKHGQTISVEVLRNNKKVVLLIQL
ncbi:MAG: M20/M25/M40 family metallo-hydrolase [Bacteroidia bacterium]|nr:M20/M25/M40 family metallo-hydrolase [Bacteroidia bacterium]